MIHIQAATIADWPAIKSIYIEGIETGNATFITTCDLPEGEDWFAKKVAGAVFKAVDEQKGMRGWAALQGISSACNYAGVAEVSVYVSQAAQQQGIGSLLLKKLIAFSEANNIWTLQASIFPENTGSLQLHQKHGFTTIGRRKAIGKINGHWRDEILLERRSAIIF
ncbi:MAG: N-acetyltransferase family protein [Saprospiraceae bacterium]